MCLLWTTDINGIIHHVLFYGCIFSFSIMFLRFIHAIACISMPFLFNGWIIFHSMAILHSHLFYWSTHQLVDIWAVSTFGVLWIKLSQHSCTSFCVNICFHFSWKYLGVELWNHHNWRTTRLFSKAAAPLQIHTNNGWAFHFLHILSNTYYLSLLF